MQRRTRRIALSAIAVLALGTVLTACGDDDEDDAKLAAYCENTAAIETVGEPDIDFENASPDEIKAGAKAFATDELLPIADKIVPNAPDEVKDDIDVLYGATKELAETGDFEAAFENPKVEAASKRAHEHDLGACDWERVDVSAKDYKFEGIPEELEPGITSFEFSNDGKEAHELVVLRKNDDTTETFDQLLELPQEEAETKVTFAAGAFGLPGDSDYGMTDLTSGEYIAVCFISVGTTGEDHEGDGPPHFTKGMRHEFTVS
jgi:hypothetical protein